MVHLMLLLLFLLLLLLFLVLRLLLLLLLLPLLLSPFFVSIANSSSSSSSSSKNVRSFDHTTAAATDAPRLPCNAVHSLLTCYTADWQRPRAGSPQPGDGVDVGQLHGRPIKEQTAAESFRGVAGAARALEDRRGNVVELALNPRQLGAHSRIAHAERTPCVLFSVFLPYAAGAIGRQPRFSRRAGRVKGGCLAAVGASSACTGGGGRLTPLWSEISVTTLGTVCF